LGSHPTYRPKLVTPEIDALLAALRRIEAASDGVSGGSGD
jgi:hypothetical protein